MRTCSTTPLSAKDRSNVSSRLSRYKTFLTGRDEPTATLPIMYTVLHSNENENVSVVKIQANHEQLNLDFTATNEVDRDRFPHCGSFYIPCTVAYSVPSCTALREDSGFSTEALIGIIIGAIFIVVIVAVITGVFYSSSHSASVSAYTRSE